MRGKPPIIVVTLVLSALLLVTWTTGLPNTVYGTINALYRWFVGYEGLPGAIIFSRVIRLLLMPALACAVLYACLRRARWERYVCLSFSMLLGGLMLMSPLFPDPHPLFPIKGAAQEAGAKVGEWLMYFFALFYPYRMMFGRNAKRYFAREQ